MSESYLVIELNQQPVELCKLLKIANLVSGGGEAKVVISEGYVLLNGEVEYQKRKKVYHEDVIEFNGEVVQLMVNETLTETASESIEHSISEGNIDDMVENNVKTQSPLQATTTQEKTKSNNKAAKKAKAAHTNAIPMIQDDIVKVPRKRKPISF